MVEPPWHLGMTILSGFKDVLLPISRISLSGFPLSLTHYLPPWPSFVSLFLPLGRCCPSVPTFKTLLEVTGLRDCLIRLMTFLRLHKVSSVHLLLDMGTCAQVLRNQAPCSMTLLKQNQCKIFYQRYQRSLNSGARICLQCFFSKHLQQKDDTN